MMTLLINSLQKILRRCIICGKEARTEKELGLFLKSSPSKYGRQNKCKLCKSPPRPPLHYLRKCLGCGLEAHFIEELDLFIRSPKSRYKHLNRCKKCNVIRAKNRLNNMTETQREKHIKDFKIWEKTNLNRINRNKNKINFKGKDIHPKNNPRNNICSVCGKKYPEEKRRVRMKMKEDTRKCPKCSGTNIISDPENGERICGSCGLVIEEDPIDMGPEWRAFTVDERNSRSRTGIGASLTLYDKGLSTVFRGDRDATGRKLTSEARLKMDRLRRYDNRSKFDETWRRNLSIAMAELDRISVLLHIPSNVKEQAAHIYRKALKFDLIRGRSIDAFVAACLYAACRAAEVPRPIKKVSEASTRDHSEVARTYRLLIRELKIRMPVDEPIKFVPSIAAKLELRLDTEQKAINILRTAKVRQGLSGKDPRGLAAAALYMACLENNDKRIQKEVAQAAGTTEVTLRNRLRGLEESIGPVANAASVDMPVPAPMMRRQMASRQLRL